MVILLFLYSLRYPHVIAEIIPWNVSHILESCSSSVLSVGASNVINDKSAWIIDKRGTDPFLLKSTSSGGHNLVEEGVLD